MDDLVKKVNKLIKQIARGKLNALDNLYLLTAKMLLFMAKKYLFDECCAEDLVSDTYLKVVKGATKFDETQNGLNWIYKILRNGAMDYNRRGARAADYLENRFPPEFENADDFLTAILIKDGLAQLSDTEKQIIYLRYFEGLRLKEIALRIEKPVSTTSDMIERTLKKLRKLLK